MAELTFENALKKLEKITELLENGQLTLEDSIKYYDEGMRLSDFCNKKLEEAKLKITQLNELETDNSNDEKSEQVEEMEQTEKTQ